MLRRSSAYTHIFIRTAMVTPIRAGVALAAALLVLSSMPAQAQDLHPSRRPSPIGISSTHVGDTYVKVTYGRPYMRNRQIFGTNTDTETYLVPFGQVWRTGANEATEITTTGPLLVNGERLEAGTYSIFTEPGASEWVVHFSPHLGLDGTGHFDFATNTFTQVFDPADDVLTLTVPSSQLSEPVDQFTISVGDEALSLRWERTEVRIPVEAAP